MSFITDIQTTPKNFSGDAGGRQRTSTLTTLFDGKTLITDDTDLWDNVGTGTFTFNTNQMNMAVTAGQYCIRQGKIYCPYFSGKSQLIEATADTFGNEAGLIKRLGYFSSSAVAPYTANFDGYYIESNGDTSEITLNVVNNGVSKLSLDWTLWDNYELISSYNWDNFTVTGCDFLWLGGAVLRLFIKTEKGFVLAHTFNYSGSNPGVFMQTPNQPIRYEIRSTTGAGNFNAICSQVASEGSTTESGKGMAIRNPVFNNCNIIDTIYALKGIRKTSTYRNSQIELTDFGVGLQDNNDPGFVYLILNPTVAGTFTYSTNGKIEEATGDVAGTNTVTGGEIIGMTSSASFGGSATLVNNFLNKLLISVDNTPDEVVLCYQPFTGNQDVYGYINYKAF